MENQSLKSNYEKIQNEQKKLTTVMYKNNTATYAMFVISLILIITRNVWGIVIGAILLLCAIFVHFKIKDFKVMEIYENCVVLFDKKSGELSNIIYNNYVQEWNIVNTEGSCNFIRFLLKDQNTISVESYQLNKAFDTLQKTMPTKEKMAKQLKSLSTEKIKLENPFKSKKKK